MVNGGTFKNYLDTVLASSGFNLSMTMNDQKDGDFTWKELKYELQVSDPDKIDLDSETTRKVAGMVAGLLQKFSIVMAIKNQHVYMVIGENSAVTLKNLVKDDRVEPSVEGSDTWKKYLQTIPTDSQFVGNIATDRLIDLVNASSDNAIPLKLEPAERSGIFSYIRLGSNTMESSSFWDIREIKPISKFVSSQMSGLFGK